MDRAKILAMIDVGHGRGLEIGPLNRPVVTRAMGTVEYVDRAPGEALRRWYANNPEVDIADIVEVDHVWGGQTLFECVGGRRVYDYLVASHVIEHVPDLFGWLGEIGAVLADGGVVSLVVPDKRFTFDILRRTSSDSEMVDAHVRRLRRPDVRQVFDHFNGVRTIDGSAVFKGALAAETPPAHTAPELLAMCRQAFASQDYIDVHCWVFTPASFLHALDLASQLGLLPFEIACVHPTPPGSHEFFVSLRRLPEGLSSEAQRAAFLASGGVWKNSDEGQGDVETEELMARLSAAESAIAAVGASASWRLTAPLRKLSALLRRSRG